MERYYSHKYFYSRYFTLFYLLHLSQTHLQQVVSLSLFFLLSLFFSAIIIVSTLTQSLSLPLSFCFFFAPVFTFLCAKLHIFRTFEWRFDGSWLFGLLRVELNSVFDQNFFGFWKYNFVKFTFFLFRCDFFWVLSYFDSQS